MCVTDRHDMTLTVKAALNLNTTNQLNIVGFPMKGSQWFHKQAVSFADMT